MPRQRSPNRDKAFEMWKESKGEKPLVEIAEELGLKDTQIRKWKSQDKWEDQLKGTLLKKKSNVTNENKDKNKTNIKPIVKEVESVLENFELTDKQRLFCIYYSKSFNATQSYKKAYGCSYATALTEGPALKNNPRISSEIDRLKSIKLTDAHLEPGDIFQKYIDIAFADITDFVSFGQEEVPVMTAFGPLEVKNPKTGKKEVVTKMANVVKFKDSTEIDGTILTEVSQGKEGAKIKLADKMKALEKLEKYFDLIPDTWKRKIEEEKLAIQKRKLGEEEGEVDDDGFLEALKGEVSEVWDDAEED